MPTLKIEGYGEFNVPEGTRLVRAIEDNGVPILHRCGGFAKCATCRVEFYAGEPQHMTEAEHSRLELRELLGQVRLSCQCLCTHDMHVRPLMTIENSDYTDPGSQPEPEITPEPVWQPLPVPSQKSLNG